MIEYVEIRNSNRVLIGVIDTAQSIIWKTEYYGTGQFEIYVPASARVLPLLRVGHFITRRNEKNVGIIESINITFDAQYGRMIIASGRFAKSLLDRRLVMRLANNSMAGRVSILPTLSTGLVETAVRRLVTDNIISAVHPARNIPFIRLGALAGIQRRIVDEDGDVTNRQTSFGNLLEHTDELLQEYQLGAYMSLDLGTLDLLYHVYEGETRTLGNAGVNRAIVFSQDYDNLLSSDYKYQTAAYKNTALIGGEGEGVDRHCAMIGANASGVDRREVWVDASGQSKTYQDDAGTQKTYTDDEYTALLKSAGSQDLEQRQIVQSFTGTVDLTHSGLVFGSDYWVGDIVSVHDVPIDIYTVARIITATEIQDENGYKIDVEYGI